MAQRLMKWGLVTLIGGGSIASLHNHGWDIGSVGIVRFGRAAYSVGGIAVDYKSTFSKVDRNHPDYYKIRSECHTRSAQRLLDLCCVNGGVFIKVGQHLGALDYLLPTEYTSTLKVLHSKAPRVPLSDVYHVIKEDLKHTPQELFSSFDEEPLGVASLAQVHKATLQDGSTVAVKVQHRKVRAHSYVDIKTMEVLVHAVAWVFPEFQFLWLAEEAKKNLPLELDFLHEGRNAERAQKMFEHLPWLKIPRVYWDLSSDRVLTMEFCEGGQIDDNKYIEDNKIDGMLISQRLGRLYSEMIFVHGYVHCDPHPGNILVKKTDRDTELILLDHGLYSSLTDTFRLRYAKLWLALLTADVKGMKKYGNLLGVGDLFGLLACMLTARSWNSLNAGIGTVQRTNEEGAKIKEFVATYFVEITEVLSRVPREMLLILKTNDLLRSLEFSLQTHHRNPTFISMTRCCVRAFYAQRARGCSSFVGRASVSIAHQWVQFKITLYSVYRWFRTSFWVKRIM